MHVGNSGATVTEARGERQRTMRQEVLVGLALVVGGGTAAAVALSDGSEGTGASTASTAVRGQQQADTQRTAADRPTISRLRIRVGGRVVVVEANQIGFRYCDRHVRTCAAIRPAQRRRLRRNQRRAVAAARAKLRERAAPPPSATPAPQPAPAPSQPPAPPVPQPHAPPSGETSTA